MAQEAAVLVIQDESDDTIHIVNLNTIFRAYQDDTVLPIFRIGIETNAAVDSTFIIDAEDQVQMILLLIAEVQIQGGTVTYKQDETNAWILTSSTQKVTTPE